MRAKWLRPVVASALLGVMTLSCGTVEEDKDLADVVSLEAACRDQLSAGNYSEARNKAETVINTARLAAVDNVAVDRARFCYTTANSLYQLNELTKNLQTLLQTVFGLFGGGLPGGSPRNMTPQDFKQLALDYRDGRLDPKIQSTIGILLGSFTNPIQNTLEENQAQLEEIIKKKRFSWNVQHLPVKIADADLMDAGGSYDLGEIYLLYGLTRSLLSTFYLIQSQDLSIVLGPLADYVLGDVDAPILKITEHPGRAITNLLAVLMGTSPSFMRLDSQLGAELMKKAGEGYSKGFGSVLDSVKYMKEKRHGDQTAHVVEYKRENDEDFFIVHIKFNNGANPIPIVDLQKFDGIAIPLRDDVVQSLQHLRDDFADTPGVNTNLQRDIFPIVALVVVVLVKSGAFDALIDLALSGSGPDTKKIADQVLNIVGNNQDIVVGALVALVPVEIEFDFGHIFKAPGGLRDIFPAWTQTEFSNDVTGLTALTYANIVYSYECDAGEPADPLMEDTYLCKKATDDSHFQKLDATNPAVYYMWDPVTDTSVPTPLLWKNYASFNNFGPKWSAGAPIEPDGIQSKIPYIGFKDASFGGLLYLNVETLPTFDKLKSKKGFQPATLTTLNATLASIVATVSGFLK